MPLCDADGNYMREQCSFKTNECFCADATSGDEIEGTRTALLSFDFDCDDISPGMLYSDISVVIPVFLLLVDHQLIFVNPFITCRIF